MRKFDVKSFCAKCGYRGRMVDGIVLKAAAAVQYIEPPPEDKTAECILRTCKRCGYKWREACADA